MASAIRPVARKSDQQAGERPHALIAKASHNPIMTRFVEVINKLGSASHRHRIVAAIADRDPDATRMAMMQHLEPMRHELLGELDTADKHLIRSIG